MGSNQRMEFDAGAWRADVAEALRISWRSY